MSQTHNSFIEDVLIDDVPLPQACVDYPAMLSPGDRRAYYLAAKNFFRFRGLIVDAGTFLGGTTKCLVEGLKANRAFDSSSGGRLIKAYDRFIVGSDPYARFLKSKFGQERGLDDSFRDIFDRLMAPDQAFFELFAGDILKKAWDFDSHIEILGLDVCKGRELTAHTARMFLPFLRPYESLLINQDYLLERQPQIAVLFEALGNRLVKVAEIGWCGVFLCTQPLGLDVVEGAISQMLDPERALVLMQKAVEKAHSRHSWFTLTMGCARLAAEGGATARAREILQEAELVSTAWPDVPKSLKVMLVQTHEYVGAVVPR
jgi:hypothetical protein